MSYSIINEIYSSLGEVAGIQSKLQNDSSRDRLSEELLNSRLRYIEIFFNIAKAFHIKAEHLISNHKLGDDIDKVEKIITTVMLSDDFYWLTSWLILGNLDSSELSKSLDKLRQSDGGHIFLEYPQLGQKLLLLEGKNCFYWGALHCTAIRCCMHKKIVDPAIVRDRHGIWESANISTSGREGSRLNEDATNRFTNGSGTLACIRDDQFKREAEKYAKDCEDCYNKTQKPDLECEQCLPFGMEILLGEKSASILADWVQDLLTTETYDLNRVRHMLPKSDSLVEGIYPLDPNVRVFPNLAVIEQLKSRLGEHRSYLHFLANTAEIQSHLEEVKSQSERLTNSLCRSNSGSDSSLNSWHLYLLRDWNSFTPLLTAEQRKDPGHCSGGGGIFLKHGQRGIVIDPGFDFLMHFYEAELSPADITDIVVTHDHYDHSASLSALLNLLFEYRRRNEESFVNFYLCRGVFDQYAHCIVDFEHFGSVVPLAEVHARIPHKHKLGDRVTMFSTETYHGEPSGFGRGVGLIFKFQSENGDFLPALGFTSDTGWFEDRQNGKNTSTPFKDLNVDVMVFNIGSLKIDELRDSGHYKKHLGMRGVLQCIEQCTGCRLALLTEFGEECKGERQWFADSVTDYLRKHLNRKDFQCFPTDHKTHLMAKDTGELHIGSGKNLHEYRKIKCVEEFGSPFLSWE